MQSSTYRNITEPKILQDDSYGIEGKYLVSIYSESGKSALAHDSKPTRIGKIVEKLWKEIPEHFNNIETKEYILTEDSFMGYINIDLSGKSIGQKQVYYNVVSQFEIAFGMMVSQKNPFLVEGSLFHVVSWLKAASLIEIIKDCDASFKWKSGYFDFTVNKNLSLSELMGTFKNS